MFCDLVNGIAAKLDAEEWRDLVALTEQQLIVQAISNPNITARGHPAAHEAKEFFFEGKSFVSRRSASALSQGLLPVAEQWR